MIPGDRPFAHPDGAVSPDGAVANGAMANGAVNAASDADAAAAVRLEPMRRRHVRECAEIEKVLFAGDSPWPPAAFHSELDLGGHYLVAVDGSVAGGDEHVLGYAGLAVMGKRGDHETSLHTIGVRPEHQGSGLGKALLRAVLEKADELAAPVFLEVRTDNDSAIGLYEKHGFRRLGVRKGYYQPSGADAYTMRRDAITGERQEDGH
ncbi:ribosomal-protein-alanine N-acetyltransferase [Prauserella isguenensis]|uniref:Ribosomal-protein-alanine N-acetyltransferase n=1 Tax=Prauserella isguenensis TaxID=1470180 RepID=A0A839RVJ2_9PSEU|nr:ribosomal-protein-alanine N-acetyltransferase [Prauserella isguenensis]